MEPSLVEGSDVGQRGFLGVLAFTVWAPPDANTKG